LSDFKRNIFYVYLTNALNGILGIILVPLCVKMMGTSGYGLFSIYAVLLSYFSLADLGISKNLFRQLSAEREESTQRYNLQIALGMYLIVTAVLLLTMPLMIVGIPLYVFPVSAENLAPLRLIVFLTLIEYVISIPLIMLQNYCIANEKFDCYSKFTFISGVYRYLLLFTAVWTLGSPVAIVAIMAARRIIDLFAALKIMGALPRNSWRPVFDLAVFKSIISRSSALTFAQLFQSTYIAMGSFLVNKYFGLHGLGIYRAVFDLVNKIWFVSNGIALVLFPKFALMLSVPDSRKRLISLSFVMLCLSWSGYSLLSVTGTLFAPLFLAIIGLYKSEMSAMFILLLLGVSINSHANLSYEFLQAAGRYRLVAVLNMIALILLYLSFNLLLSHTGIYAIAWAWIISQTLYSTFTDCMSLKEMNATSKKHLILLLVKLLILSIPLSAIFIRILSLPNFYIYILLIVIIALFAAIAIRFNNEIISYRSLRKLELTN